VGVMVGVGVDVAVGVVVGVGVGPAWATADQTVTLTAAITRGTTTERRIVALDTAASLRPTAEGLGGTVEASPKPETVGDRVQLYIQSVDMSILFFLSIILQQYQF